MARIIKEKRKFRGAYVYPTERAMGKGKGGCSLFLPVYFHTNDSDWAKNGGQTFTFSDDDSFVQS